MFKYINNNDYHPIDASLPMLVYQFGYHFHKALFDAKLACRGNRAIFNGCLLINQAA
jgi:hypothetical protein|tara:strand:- start:1652 stop:1822 length:171 start_codon:yes stop_codon:yes gene_type:complete